MERNSFEHSIYLLVTNARFVYICIVDCTFFLLLSIALQLTFIAKLPTQRQVLRGMKPDTFLLYKR